MPSFARPLHVLLGSTLFIAGTAGAQFIPAIGNLSNPDHFLWQGMPGQGDEIDEDNEATLEQVMWMFERYDQQVNQSRVGTYYDERIYNPNRVLSEQYEEDTFRNRNVRPSDPYSGRSFDENYYDDSSRSTNSDRCVSVSCPDLPNGCNYRNSQWQGSCRLHCGDIECDDDYYRDQDRAQNPGNRCVSVSCPDLPSGCRYRNSQWQGSCRLSCGTIECDDDYYDPPPFSRSSRSYSSLPVFCPLIACAQPGPGCRFADPPPRNSPCPQCGRIVCDDGREFPPRSSSSAPYNPPTIIPPPSNPNCPAPAPRAPGCSRTCVEDRNGCQQCWNTCKRARLL